MLKYNYGIYGVACLLGAFLILCQPVLAQKTWYVATGGDDANFGTNGWADAYQTISNAIAKSSALDTVLVGPGEYFLTTALILTKDIHLFGAEGPSNTIINANYPAYSIKALNIYTGCIVAGFTFTNAIDDVVHQDGGGVLVYGGVLLNCLIYGNQAPHGIGGGVSMVHDADIDACTIVGNSAGVAGGGVYTHWAASGDLRLFIRNSIVYSNEAPTGSNWAGLSTQYTWFTNSCITNLAMPQGSGLITDYPEFVDSVNYNYQLQAGSPCINAGLNQPWMENAVDLVGRRRLDWFTRQVDIGCYEFVPCGSMFGIR